MYEINRNEHLEQNASKITEMVGSTIPQESISKEVTIVFNGVFEVLLVGAASLAGCYFLYKKSKLYLDKGSRPKANIWKRFARHSCSNCRFFDKNAYLKCAVHPVIVGKPEAKDCTNYWQRDHEVPRLCRDRASFFHR